MPVALSGKSTLQSITKFKYSIKLIRLSDLQMLMWICSRLLKQVEKHGPNLMERFKNNRSTSITSNDAALECGRLSNAARFELGQIKGFKDAITELNTGYKSMFIDEKTKT